MPFPLCSSKALKCRYCLRCDDSQGKFEPCVSPRRDYAWLHLTSHLQLINRNNTDRWIWSQQPIVFPFQVVIQAYLPSVWPASTGMVLACNHCPFVAMVAGLVFRPAVVS